jgi:multicomponent Na+:H+ antiporter subunit D
VNAFADLYAAPPALMAHAAVLLAAGPLIAACAAMLAPNARWAWMISVGGAIFAFWMALCLAGEVAREGVVDYFLGGFAPPLGIAFRVDALGAMFALLVSAAAIAVALYSGHGLDAEVRKSKHTLFQAGFLLCLSGLLGISATGDAFNAFVFLEISSIGTYALVGLGATRDRRALPAAFTYLVMGTIGATFFVIGVGFLYAATGTLNMADMAARLATLGDNRAVLAGFALIVAGLALKAAIFPLHGWLPGAYAFAPSVIAAFLAATATKTAIYLMIRFVFTVFPDTDFVEAFLTWVLAPLAATAAIVCSLQALLQSDLRRMLAFSSVAQVGLIMLGVAMGGAAGIAAGLMQLTAHALAKAALFMGLGGVELGARRRTLADLAGAGRAAPSTMTAFAVAAFSLLGAPLTLGFLAKYRLAEAALAEGQGWMIAVIAVSSLLSLAYVGRIIETLFFRSAPAGATRAKDAPLGVLVPLWLLAGASVWFGIDAQLPEAVANAAAQAVGP